MKNKQEYQIDRLQRIEYLSTNLVQKLRQMRPAMEDFFATAAGFGVDYEGPNYSIELSELTEALRDE